MTEFIKISSNMVQYTIDNTENINEAFASLLLNPFVTWAKFILTDDEPNGNKVRIPKEEFSNLVKSGVYMPIKMTLGNIEGHEASIPIGVITHLQENKNRVEGLAALWNNERPEDVSFLKKMFKNDEKLNISWEIGFSESAESSKFEGVKDLHDVVLKAATLVETPAYKGRTTILALAEMERKNMDELKDKIEELEKSLAELQEEREELLEKLDGSKATVKELSSQLEELDELKEFKAEIEAERKKEARIEEIKEKFVEAGIEKDEEYFEEKSEILLNLEEESLGFFIQELVAFGKKSASAELEEEDDPKNVIPPINGGKDTPDSDALINFLKSGKTE